MSSLDIEALDWRGWRPHPAVVQDAETQRVLMPRYMNREAGGDAALGFVTSTATAGSGCGRRARLPAIR